MKSLLMQIVLNLPPKLTLKIFFRILSIYLLPRCVTLDTNLRMFQYKLLNVLYLNNMLFSFKKVDSPHCSYCNEEEEILLHLFHSCLKTKLKQA